MCTRSQIMCQLLFLLHQLIMTMKFRNSVMHAGSVLPRPYGEYLNSLSIIYHPPLLVYKYIYQTDNPSSFRQLNSYNMFSTTRPGQKQCLLNSSTQMLAMRMHDNTFIMSSPRNIGGTTNKRLGFVDETIVG